MESRLKEKDEQELANKILALTQEMKYLENKQINGAGGMSLEKSHFCEDRLKEIVNDLKTIKHK
jgi:hypothetical protein